MCGAASTECFAATSAPQSRPRAPSEQCCVAGQPRDRGCGLPAQARRGPQPQPTCSCRSGYLLHGGGVRGEAPEQVPSEQRGRGALHLWELLGGRAINQQQPLAAAFVCRSQAWRGKLPAAASPRMLRADQKIGHSDSGTRWWAALSSHQCQNCTEPRFVVLATVKNRAHGSRPASRQALARGAPLCLDGSPLDRRRVSHTQPERCRAARIAIAIAIALSSALDHPARRYRQLGSRYPPSLAPRSPGGP